MFKELFKHREKVKEHYIVEKGFKLEEWADIQMEAVNSLDVNEGCEIILELDKESDLIVNVQANGVEMGKHGVVTKREEIIANCKPIKENV